MTKDEKKFLLLLARAQHEQSWAIVEAIRASSNNGMTITAEAKRYLANSNQHLNDANDVAFPPKEKVPEMKPLNIVDDSLMSFFVDLPVEALPFCQRTKSVLLARDIQYVGNLIGYHDEQLLKLVHFGPIMLEEVKKVLATIGLTLEINLIDWKQPTKKPAIDTQVETFSWIYIKNIAVYLTHFREAYSNLNVQIGPSYSRNKDIPTFGVYVCEKDGSILKLPKLPSYNELINNLRLIREGRDPV